PKARISPNACNRTKRRKSFAASSIVRRPETGSRLIKPIVQEVRMFFRKAAAVAPLLAFSVFAAVPAPESHFGHKIGVDNELLDWAKVVSYSQSLEKSSDRLKFREIGKSVEGRPMIAAFISSPANLKNLDHYRDIQSRLSDPRRTSPAEAARLQAEGKAI